MPQVTEMAALICMLVARRPQCRLPNVPVRDVAALVVQEARRYDLEPAVLAGVLAHESKFRVDARGRLGELGLAQLYRGTIATHGYDHLTDDQLMRPAINIRLGARHLARVKRICGGVDSDPASWVGTYSGQPCRSSRYGRAVARELARAQLRLAGASTCARSLSD